MLRDGGAAELIVELKQLRDTADRGKQRASIQGEINYFETNRGRMNYDSTESSTCRLAAAPWKVPARTSSRPG